MIVEFAGLPGAGKSTAAEHLVRSAREQGLTVDKAGETPPMRGLARLTHRWSHPVRLAATILSSPGCVYALMRGLSGSGRSRAEKWFAFRHVAVTMHRLKQARRRTERGTLTVFHEGICQRVFMAFVDADGPTDPMLVRRFVAAAPRPDVIITLRVDPAVGLARVRARGHGGLSYRFEGLTDEDLTKRLLDAQRLLLDTADYMAEGFTPRSRTFVLEADDLDTALEHLTSIQLPELLRAASTEPP